MLPFPQNGEVIVMEIVKIGTDGRVALPKDVRKSLHISKGDLLGIEVKDDEIILMPIAKIPRSQTWFWSKEWQKREREVERSKKEEKVKGPLTLETALKELKLEKI